MRAAWSLTAVLALALAGCSGQLKVATVSGSVTVDGKPTEGVALTFAHADGRVATAVSDAQGSYTAAEVPVGEVTVTALLIARDQQETGMIAKNRGAADPSRPPPPEVKSKTPKLDAKFADPNASGLKHTATEGQSTFNVPLTTQK
jgi:hypothetical protein